MIDFELVIDECDKDIVNIIQHLGVDYVKDNDWICIRCCFHNGSKFNLKYRDKKFFCFSECRKSYSIIDVVTNILDLNIVEASKWISEILGIDCNSDKKIIINHSLRDSKRLLDEYKKIKKTNNKIKYIPVPQTILNDIEPCYCKYIEDWGISEETAREFDIGFARGGEFDSRIIFPIDAPDGTIISLTGRLPNAENFGLKKYHILNDSESSNTLYNISRAIKYAKELGYIFVVEGMKSVMMMYQWGYKNVVAVIGASLGEEQAKLLLKLGVNVYCIGDYDKAGQQMMQSIYNRLYKYLKVNKIDIGIVTNIEKTSIDELTKQKFEVLLKEGSDLISDDIDF